MTRHKKKKKKKKKTMGFAGNQKQTISNGVDPAFQTEPNGTSKSEIVPVSEKNRNAFFSNGVDAAFQTELNGTSKSEIVAISKLRQAAPQILAVTAKNLLLISFGCTLGFSTILIPELQKSEPEIVVTLEELTWISSMNLILVPVGCLGSGFAAGYFSRKKSMMILNGPFIIAWVIYYYSYNSTMLLYALAVTGLIGGLIQAPVITYQAEVTQPHLRGMLAATEALAVIIGIFIQMLAGSLTYWRNVVLINIALPTISFVPLLMVPESPYWLIEKGRLDEALLSLRWLRGWVKPEDVREEYNNICESIWNSVRQEASSEDSYWSQFMTRAFWMPCFLVCWTFVITNFNGMATLQTYAVYVFEKLDAPIGEYTATVLLGAAEVLGTLCCVTLIHFTGKRGILLLSTIGTALCFFVVALYGFMIERGTIDDQSYNWIPTYVLIGSAYLANSGIVLVPWILLGEVFPVRVRNAAVGTMSSFGYFCTFIVNKVFLYMVNGITLPGTFWFYSGVGFVGALVIYLTLPETEGRTLREIEEHFAGIQSLDSRPRTEELPFKEKWAISNPTSVVDDVESKL